ncbi:MULTISPECIES: MarR family winged helix-turn-helix transcriptional regulator [Mammaliicoccus]|uniref:HTH-type transcriptional regulator MgrA n=1 Tax=Mammaliicoccus fleurettii TaxID=150056 RepID=A0ABS5MND0_9STAP|nr:MULTISPECIES: MarR family transcriptional regulator [Mammaliicoccus]HCN61385.1 MarR family transcriptional regulator [Staphylococcus sp.]MBL0847401.1 MarR family transcriptional regulator [Mammaliicoccus fleurettii]MBS3672180.1 MarR family transcriptional regulator [Mammaliicoccus fleurettii]MBS3697151.1 MarR family transcriptional regulator [Mammaliicoccus fleurettii]MBW0765151.1 MarR family transcriptional regulator [Mammaliicoccus fleurettii]
MGDNLNIHNQLCFNLYNAQRQVNRYYSNKIFKEYNITYPQYLVLTVLWETEPVNVKKLVTDLALDTGTVSPLLKRMENLDLIKRERSELDQREVFVHLTEKSKQMKQHLHQASQLIQDVSELNDEETKQLNSLLQKLINNVDKINHEK